MIRSFCERLQMLKVEEILRKYPGLRLSPSADEYLRLAGDLHFRAQGPGNELVEDTYALELSFPPTFPRDLGRTWETEGRIPPEYHKLDDGSLCLAAPTQQRLILSDAPTLVTYIEKLLVPYLYRYSFFRQNGKMPYDDLAHGDKGICDYLSSLFASRETPHAKEFLRLAAMRRRNANKMRCPCGSGKRLGRCHNRQVNGLRDRLGRRWFREEYSRVASVD